MKDDHTYRQKWRWPPEVRRYIRKHTTGKTLHVCSGDSEIGDVKLDLDPDRDPDVKGNMRALPFPNDTFDSVVSDPPWKLGFFQRHRPFYEAVRVCRPGGRVVYNSRWRPESNEADCIDQQVRSDSPYRDISLLTVWVPVQARLEGPYV